MFNGYLFGSRYSSTGGGGGTPDIDFVQLTVEKAQTLIATSAIEPGTTYEITDTDFQGRSRSFFCQGLMADEFERNGHTYDYGRLFITTYDVVNDWYNECYDLLYNNRVISNNVNNVFSNYDAIYTFRFNDPLWTQNHIENYNIFNVYGTGNTFSLNKMYGIETYFLMQRDNIFSQNHIRHCFIDIVDSNDFRNNTLYTGNVKLGDNNFFYTNEGQCIITGTSNNNYINRSTFNRESTFNLTVDANRINQSSFGVHFILSQSTSIIEINNSHIGHEVYFNNVVYINDSTIGNNSYIYPESQLNACTIGDGRIFAGTGYNETVQAGLSTHVYPTLIDVDGEDVLDLTAVEELTASGVMGLVTAHSTDMKGIAGLGLYNYHPIRLHGSTSSTDEIVFKHAVNNLLMKNGQDFTLGPYQYEWIEFTYDLQNDQWLHTNDWKKQGNTVGGGGAGVATVIQQSVNQTFIANDISPITTIKVNTAGIILRLPAISTIDTYTLTVKDMTGGVDVSPILLQCNAADVFEYAGNVDYYISANYGFVTMQADAASNKWMIINANS